MLALRFVSALAVALIALSCSCSEDPAPQVVPQPNQATPPSSANEVVLIPDPTPSELDPLDAPPPEPMPQASAEPATAPQDEPDEDEDDCNREMIGLTVFSPNGRRLAIEFEGGRVQVFDTTTWKPVSEIKFQDALKSLEFSPNGRYLFGVNDPDEYPDVLHVARVSDGARLWRKRIREGRFSFVVAKDSSWFAAVVRAPKPPGDPDDIYSDPEPEWHVELVALPSFSARRSFFEPKRITKLKRPAWRPRKVPNPDPERFKAPPGGPPRMDPVLPISNDAADYSRDSAIPGECCELFASGDSRTLSISYQEVTSLVDTRRAAVMTTLVGSSPAFSPSGRFVVLGRESGAVAIFDTRRRSAKLFYDALCDIDLTHRFPDPDFSPDESLVAIGGRENRLCLVSPTSAKLKTFLPNKLYTPMPTLERGRADSGGWSADGSAIVSTRGFHDMMFRVDTNEDITFDAKWDHIVRYVRRADASFFAIDLQQLPRAEVIGHTVRPLPPAHENCQSVRWSPDREKLLNDSDAEVTICSTRNFQPITRIRGTVDDLEFDPLSRFVYGKDYNHVVIWSAADGKQVFNTDSCSTSTDTQ